MVLREHYSHLTPCIPHIDLILQVMNGLFVELCSTYALLAFVQNIFNVLFRNEVCKWLSQEKHGPCAAVSLLIGGDEDRLPYFAVFVLNFLDVVNAVLFMSVKLFGPDSTS